MALTLAAIVEEGYLISDLERILDSFAKEMEIVGAAVSCGDTKVMPHGDLDGIILNTTGIGVAPIAVSDTPAVPERRS